MSEAVESMRKLLADMFDYVFEKLYQPNKEAVSYFIQAFALAASIAVIMH